MEGSAYTTVVIVPTVIQAQTARLSFNVIILIVLTMVHVSWTYRLTKHSVPVTKSQ